jgi:2-phospho-L-lactate guanylyltransferase
MPTTFALLVPVKGWATAKSRLDPPTLPTARLAAAFATDAIAAALASPAVDRVHVVTDEAAFAPPGVVLLPDEGDGDLNRALRAAAARVRREQPGVGVAAMCADLPSLRAEDLTAALRHGEDGRWFVGDADGTGTTLLVAAPGVGLDPRFGPGSAAAHESSGAIAVPGRLASLRRDVDTAADLDAALALGVGPATRAVWTTVNRTATRTPS